MQDERASSGSITLREWVSEQFTAQQRALEMLATTQQRSLEMLAETQARETKVLKDQVEKIADLHADAHKREHALTEEALSKAEQAVDRRLLEMNNFRAQLTDQAAT